MWGCVHYTKQLVTSTGLLGVHNQCSQLSLSWLCDYRNQIIWKHVFSTRKYTY